ncbi:MAG: hypothetical protein MJ090_04580 [Clostridia bacterium]|nr:hypothetical protein [Clostridia bacterium]
MKKITFLLTLILLIFVFSFSAFAANRDFTVKIPKSYTAVYADESKAELSKKLGMEEEKLQDYYSDNGIELLAISQDNKSQIIVSEKKDDFSVKTENLSAYSDNDIKKLGKELVKDIKLAFVIENRNSKKFIKISVRKNDSGGEFTATQFITVANGKLYNISFLSEGKELDKQNLKILDSFSVNEEKSDSGISLFITIFIDVAIAGFAAIIVLMIYGIIKNKIKNEKEEN